MIIRELKIIYVSSEKWKAEQIKVDSPKKVYEFVKDKIGAEIREHFLVLLVDNKNRIIGWYMVAVGTISECIVHPREVYSIAIRECASSIIVCHNHPSGELSPSYEDIKTTQRLRESGEIIGIELLDHIIVSDSAFYSMREAGNI
jgi:DNA repair protein RadC